MLYQLAEIQKLEPRTLCKGTTNHWIQLLMKMNLNDFSDQILRREKGILRGTSWRIQQRILIHYKE